jgi:hypothetical protein
MSASLQYFLTVKERQESISNSVGAHQCRNYFELVHSVDFSGNLVSVKLLLQHFQGIKILHCLMINI